jgi:hypothetical protein
MYKPGILFAMSFVLQLLFLCASNAQQKEIRANLQLAGDDSLYLPIMRCREEKGVDCFHNSFEDDFVHRAAPACDVCCV